MKFTPEELIAIKYAFPNESRRHHHKLIRELAEELLSVQFQALLLKQTADMAQRQEKLQIPACEVDNTGDGNRWEDPRDTFGGSTDVEVTYPVPFPYVPEIDLPESVA